MIRRQRESRFGGQAVFFGDQPNQTATVLDVSEADQVGVPGPWVLTLQQTALADRPPGTTIIYDLLAEVIVGTGGSSFRLELDTMPGFAIQLPFPTVRVNLYWDELPVTAGGAAQWGRPAQTMVRATLHQGTSSSYAYRTYTMDRDNAINRTTRKPIPPFAKRWYVSSGLAAPFNDPLTRMLLQTVDPVGFAGNNLQELSGTQLVALLTGGQAAYVPPMCNRWWYIPNTPPSIVTRMHFQVAL